MKKYLNLVVAISPIGDGAFEARVSSSQGDGRARFTPPFRLADVIGHAVGPTRWRSLGTVKPIAPAYATARECGVALFEALFTGEARDVLAATEAEARTLPDTGVRIRLAFDLTNPATAEVAALPWELMRRRNDDPLVVTMQTALVRALDVPKPIKPRPLIRPLRILVIRANPEGTGALNLAKEGQMLVDALKRLPGIAVDEVAPIAGPIRDQLAREQYHVIHYMGHGDYQADRGGMLLLENEDRSPHLVSAATFAAWLKDEPLRLVFLNACETGTTPDGASAHPFAGVAAALIQSNAPAVVAMQFPISDSAAIEFARTFYTRVADGFPVDAAVAEGRKALFDDEATEWATPVLYLRPVDGDLFDNDAAEIVKAPAPAPEPTKPMPLITPAPPQRDIVRTLGIGAIGALLLLVLLIAWADGWFGGSMDAETQPAASVATEATPAAADGEAVPPIIEGETGATADAFNALPPEVWINDDGSTSPDGQTSATGVLIASLSGTDEEKFAEIQRLANNKHPAAQYVLGDIYFYGLLGQQVSKDRAKSEFVKAANEGLPAAQYWVGSQYKTGETGFPEDLDQARDYLTRATDGGNTAAKELLKQIPASS